jgi:tape measure domain-containing protein
MASRGVKGIDIQANLSLDISSLIRSLEKDLSAKSLGIEIKPSLANFDAIKKAIAGLSGEIEIISPDQASLFANLLKQLIAVGDRLKSITNFSPIFENATASAKKLNQEITLLRDSLTSINRRKINIFSQKQSDAIAKALSDIKEIQSLSGKSTQVASQAPSTQLRSAIDVGSQISLDQFEDIQKAVKAIEASLKGLSPDRLAVAAKDTALSLESLSTELLEIKDILPKDFSRKIGAQKGKITKISKQISEFLDAPIEQSPDIPKPKKTRAKKTPDAATLISTDIGLEEFESISQAIKNLQLSIKKIPSDEFLSASNRIDEEVTRLRAELEGVVASLPKGLGRKVGAQKAALTRISKQIDGAISAPPISVDIKLQDFKVPDLDPIVVDAKVNKIQTPDLEPVAIDLKVDAPKIPDLETQIREDIKSVDAATEKLFQDTAKQFDLYREIVNQVVKESNLSSIAKDFLGDVPKLAPLPPSAPKNAAAQYNPDLNLVLVKQKLIDDIAQNIISPADIVVLVHELRHAIQSSFGNFTDADIKATNLINLLKPIQAELTQFQVDSIIEGATGSTELFVDQLKAAGIDINAEQTKDRIEFINQLEEDAYTFQALYTKKIIDSLKGVVPSLEKATPDFDRLKLAQSVSGLITEADLAINQAIGGVNKEIDRAKAEIKTVGSDLPRFAIEEVNNAINSLENILEGEAALPDLDRTAITQKISGLIREIEILANGAISDATEQVRQSEPDIKVQSEDIPQVPSEDIPKAKKKKVRPPTVDTETAISEFERISQAVSNLQDNIKRIPSKKLTSISNEIESDITELRNGLETIFASLPKDFGRKIGAQRSALTRITNELNQAIEEANTQSIPDTGAVASQVNKSGLLGNIPDVQNTNSGLTKIGATASKVNGIFQSLKQTFKDSFSTFIALQLDDVFNNIFFALQDTARQIQDISIQFEAFSNSINFVSGGLEQGTNSFNAIAKSARDLKVALIPAIEGYTLLAAATQGTNLEKDTIGISQAILQAGRAYSITTDRLNNATLAIGQIAGKADVSQEELRGQLSEALPGALQVASRAFGVTTAELNKLVEAGLTADEFLPKFARQLRRETAFAAEQGSKTLGAAVQNLANARDTLFVAIGQQASPALIGLYDGLAVALNSVAGAIAPVVAGFVDLAKIGAGIAVIQGLSLGLTALTPALGFASLALKALLLDLQALTFQSFTAGITSATAGILNLVKTAVTSKIAIQGLSLGITALAGSILIGVVEAGLAVDDLNKKTQESASSITRFRDDLNRANGKPIELGIADNLDQEFRDSQSVFIKLVNLISVFQRLATGGDVIDNLNAVRSQKFFNTIDEGNAVLESSIKLRSDDARGIVIQAAAVELAGDQLARQLSIAKDSLAVTDAERQAKDNLIKQLEREIEANRRLEDSLAGVDKSYGDVLRAINKRIAGSKRAEAEALAEVAKLELQGTELQESLERRKAEATKKRISEELQAQQDLLKSLQSRQDAATNTKIIDEIEKVNKKITDLTKEQASGEIETEKAKQAERIAIIEEASQKALFVSKEAEQERLIELQKLYNSELISKEKLELEKLKVTQNATDAKLQAVEDEIRAVNNADISQKEKELKLRELREESGDLILQKLEQQKQLEESLFNIAKNRIERLAKIQTDRIELFNEELDLKTKVIESDKKAQLESEKLARLLTVQEKSLERQLTIVGKRNELLKVRSDASLFVSTAETDRLNRALEIVRKINSGDIGSQKELKALKQELSDLGVSGTVRERELIEQIGKQEAKTRELKNEALKTEQRIQSQILELEIQKTEQAQKRALIEAQSQVRTAQVELAKAPIEQAKTDLAAQKAVIESTKELAIAQKELSQASGDSEKKQAQEAIALAQRRLEIAQQEQALSRDTTSIDLARERLGLAVDNLRQQEQISSDQQLINGYQRDSLKITQAQAQAQLEIENRTNRAANRTNRAIGEASRSQGFVADPVAERRRQDELEAIRAKGKLERESNADTQKAIAEARNRFNQEDIESREKAIKAQGAITVPVSLEPLPLTDLKRQIENAPPFDLPARLKIDNNGNLLDSQALNVPTIPQPQELGNRGQNGLNQLGLDILNQLKDLGLKIPNVRPEVTATFNNQFASTDQKELLRKARNQNLADIESVFSSVVGAF